MANAIIVNPTQTVFLCFSLDGTGGGGGGFKAFNGFETLVRSGDFKAPLP